MAEDKTVLIADDEQLICELLKRIIEWDTLGLKLAGEVYNGRALYEEILEKKPDIVITDISMPEMDGIELIGRIRQKGIPCHFVIVSGYRQFEYAHTALRYDVEDYILKPVDTAELNNALNKLVKKIEDKDDESIESPDAGQEKLLLKRFFLNNVISQLAQSPLTIQAIKEEYGIVFGEGYFRMLYVQSDIAESTRDYVEDSSSVQNKISSTFYDMFKESCINILMDQTFDLLKIGINYSSDKEKEIQDKLRDYFERIQNLADLFKGYHLTLGVGNAYEEIEKLDISGKEAQAAVSSRVLMECDRIIYWKDLNQPEEILSNSEKVEFLKTLEKNFEMLDAAKFEQQMQSLFRSIRNHFSGKNLPELLEAILDIFLQTEERLFPGSLNEDYIRKQYIYAIRCAVSIPLLYKAVTQPIKEAIANLVQSVEQQNKKPVRIAFSYVEENYARQIRLEDVAAQVDLNPVYFSNVFKRETGQNFTDYLTDFRMNAAKELLRNSNDAISEIAEKTGYADTRYFSKLFKKIVGIKPSEYRKIYG